METISHSVALFIVAGFCEIGGGWLMWQWLREGRGSVWGLCGAIVLFLYGIVPTFQPAHFGRVYVAYGGFFIALVYFLCTAQFLFARVSTTTALCYAPVN